MDEVKIWALDGDSNVTPLASKDQTDTESLLEETLVRNPDLLIPGLRLVGRQTPTDGGPLDLLGVDEDGRLVVFELKRGTLSRDAVAQIIDYASDLDAKSDVALAEHIAANSGEAGIDRIEDFEEWYGENTDGQSLDSLRPLRLFLIGLGADERTERMVRFLAENTGMDISLLTFHGFAYDGKTLLARQVEVNALADPDPRKPGQRLTAEERRALLESRIEGSGVSETYSAVVCMFDTNWPRFSTSPGVWGISVKYQGRTFARVYLGERNETTEKRTVNIGFFPRAKELCLNEFKQPVSEIRPETWPRNRDPLDDPDTEIHFQFTADEWEQHQERLSALTTAVYKAWENSSQ